MGVHIVVTALAGDLEPNTAHRDLKTRLGFGPGSLVGKHDCLANAVDDEADQIFPFRQADALQQVITACIERLGFAVAIGGTHGLKHPNQYLIDRFSLREAVHADGRVPKRVERVGLKHARGFQVKRSPPNGQAT